MTIDPDNKIELSNGKAEEAAEWLLRLQAGAVEPRLKAEFDRWLALSPANRLAWERTCKTWRNLGLVEPEFKNLWEDAPHLPEKAAKPVSRRRWSGRHYAGAAMAAAALCLAVLFVPASLVRIKADYQTSTAESRTIILDDGSRVQLAAASALSTDFTNGRRTVKVLKGEAFFDVAPDTTRPFIVEAKNVTVQVLGTAFDVDLTDGVTQVALAHGSVEASFRNAPPTRLVPGEMLIVDASGAIRKENVSVEDIGGWRNGELYVVDATIGSVVEQIQRYHPAWLTMADKTLAGQRVTGFYDLRDPDRALEALVEPYRGKVHAIGDSARIITRF
ncbi:FecR family protein [Agrobacterium sp. ICMP 6402]|uniref:FecR family protein n=1 Tax=Agrobacterium sp. ICMP 6402 TaxID=2292443 RepID=UPI0012960F9B|nr:FecR family protein [Agrobacterium sp. ICMP 6402]MQB10389.1 FecR family protein [Agrobacterium sp. ICMP 6402]